MNAHQEGAYADGPLQPLPHSEAARDEVVFLPLYDSMTEDDHAYVIAAVRELAGDPGHRGSGGAGGPRS
jgi:dTDP-4-amino-4,6-dideoxygalactose transaminase